MDRSRPSPAAAGGAAARSGCRRGGGGVSFPRSAPRLPRPWNAYMTDRLPLFAVAAPGLEALCAAELRALGIAAAAEPGGAAWEGTMDELHRANLWLRTASRVVVRAAAFRARTAPPPPRPPRRAGRGGGGAGGGGGGGGGGGPPRRRGRGGGDLEE